jgi:hypothetical protein
MHSPRTVARRATDGSSRQLHGSGRSGALPRDIYPSTARKHPTTTSAERSAGLQHDPVHAQNMP